MFSVVVSVVASVVVSPQAAPLQGDSAPACLSCLAPSATASVVHQGVRLAWVVRAIWYWVSCGPAWDAGPAPPNPAPSDLDLYPKENLAVVLS